MQVSLTHLRFWFLKFLPKSRNANNTRCIILYLLEMFAFAKDFQFSIKIQWKHFWYEFSFLILLGRKNTIFCEKGRLRGLWSHLKRKMMVWIRISNVSGKSKRRMAYLLEMYPCWLLVKMYCGHYSKIQAQNSCQ